jgi:hypothetical protein
MNLRNTLRSYILEPDEIQAINCSKALLFPEKNLYCIYGPWNQTNFDSNLTWRSGRVSFGYIEAMIKQSDSTLIIGHFAIEKQYIGFGLGSRLMRSFGKTVKDYAGITHILFTESGQRDQFESYDKFFTQKLGAIREQPNPNASSYQWRWEIP